MYSAKSADDFLQGEETDGDLTEPLYICPWVFACLVVKLELRPWSFLIAMETLLLASLLLIVWFVHTHLPQNLSSLISSTLAISTLLFGFLTLSVTMHLDELRRQKKDISDLAAELITLLDKVKKEKTLSSRTIHFNTKYWHWGIDGYGQTDSAESAIRAAYDYLLKNLREVVHTCRLSIFSWAMPALALLLSSIILSLLTQFISLGNELVGTISLLSIFYGAAATILGWWDSNQHLEKNCDSIFNIRHMILGDLYRGNSHVGYLYESD
jgi:hypothetical protein